MNRREIHKHIINNLNGKKHFAKPYNYTIDSNDSTYYVKVMITSKNSQITINSKNIWEFAKGKIDGIRFMKKSAELVNLSDFMTLEKRIVIVSVEPYRVLKCLNESDVIDVSKDTEVYDTTIVKSIKGLNKAVN